MVTPLDIYTVVFQQRFHDNIRPGPTVKDVTHNVHVVHRHTLDHQRNCLNEPVCLPQVDDRVDNILIIIPLIRLIIVGVEQFINDISVILRQGFTHLRAGIFGGHPAADFDEPV